MDNFTFYSPTQFIFGKGEENQAGHYVKAFGGTRVLPVSYTHLTLPTIA